mgnify:CR=1 FL=1
MSKTCSFEGCDKPRYRKQSLCKGHYEQQRRGEELRPLQKQISKAEAERLRAQGLKKCSGCGQVKPFEKFGKDKNRKDGRDYRCKACRAEYSRQWREANPEYSRQHYESNRERHREHFRQWYRANREKRLKYKRQWRQDNPDKARAHVARRRARKLNAQTKPINWDILRDVWGENPMCIYCRTKPMEHWDHIVALANGGVDATWNYAPACASCNSSKNAKDVVDWYLPRVGLGDYVKRDHESPMKGDPA